MSGSLTVHFRAFRDNLLSWWQQLNSRKRQYTLSFTFDKKFRLFFLLLSTTGCGDILIHSEIRSLLFFCSLATLLWHDFFSAENEWLHWFSANYKWIFPTKIGYLLGNRSKYSLLYQSCILRATKHLWLFGWDWMFVLR